MKKLGLFALFAALLAAPAVAQVKQSGSVTPGHAVQWTTSGVIQDAGTAANGSLTSLGVQNNGGAGICVNSGPITGPYNALCLSASTTGAAQLSLQNFGGAAPQNLQIVINGVPASISGTPGGLDTQVQYNSSGSFAGSANMTWVSPKLTLGASATTTGQLGLASSATGVVTLQSPSGGTYNFNMPTGAGSSGQPLLSGGGGSTAQSYGTLGVGGGGTGIAAGTSGGIPYFASTSLMASSGLLTQYGVIYGGGAATSPGVTAAGTVDQVLTGSATTPGWTNLVNCTGSVTYSTSTHTFGCNTGAGAGTVTSVATGWGATGGTITATGTISVATTNPPFGFDAPINASLTASAGSSLLTVALKGNNGSDPSATNPVLVPVRSATAATGTPTWIAVTSALSIDTNAIGATLGSSNATPFRFWVVVFNNGGTPVMALINCSTANQIFALNEGVTQSTTAMDATATSAGVFYTPNGTTLSGKTFAILGYVEYSSGLTTAGTYASAPTIVQMFGSGIKKPGDVVQKVRTATGSSATGTTTVPFDNTIPQITEGDQYLSQAITPAAAANLLRVKVQAFVATNAAGTMIGALFQDATANALATAAKVVPSVSTNSPNPVVLDYTMLSGTTSSTTLRFRAGLNNANTTTFNGQGGSQLFNGVMNSFIDVEEIMGANDNMPGIPALPEAA